MKKCLFLPSVRPDMLNAYLTSLQYVPSSWDLLLALQCYTPQDMALVQANPAWSRVSDILTYPERKFPYPTRIDMYKKWYDHYDIWCSMDDDMEFTPRVDLLPMARKVCEPGVGVVSGNWVKHENGLSKRDNTPEWIEQPLTNMAGGQVFSKKVVDILLDSPVEPYLFCDIQVPLMCYIRGYKNYRYRGSLIIHRIQQKGGLIVMFKKYNMTLPDPAYCRVRPCAPNPAYEHTDNNYHMPTTKEVTALAHYLHKTQSTRVMGGDPIRYPYLKPTLING